MTRFQFLALAIVIALGGIGVPAQTQDSPAAPESATPHEGGGAIRSA
jgi:hypothetical protein